MKITQELVNTIIHRARDSSLGLDTEELASANISLDGYAQHNMHALAMLLVSAFDAKYDLISVFLAALETVEEETKREVADSLNHAITRTGGQP